MRISTFSRTLLLSLLSTLISCSNGSNAPTISGQVTLEFYEDTQLSKPFVDGLTVIVHGVRGQSIEQVIEVDETGRADLGVIENTLSVTLAYKYESLLSFNDVTKTQIQTALRSLIDIPLTRLEDEDGQFVLALHAERAFTVLDTAARGLTVSVDAATPPPMMGELDRPFVSKLQPLPTVNYRKSCDTSFRDGRAQHLGVTLFGHQLQTDGTASFLSLVTSGLDSQIQQYGYLLDLVPENNMDYAITANIQPAPILFEAIGFPTKLPDGSIRDSNLLSVELFGQRKGIDYLLSNRSSAYLTPPDLTGVFFASVDCNTPRTQALPATLLVADEFPVDTYMTRTQVVSIVIPDDFGSGDRVFSATSFISNRCTMTQRFDQLPSQILIEPPRMSYQDVNYDPDSRTATWVNDAPEEIVEHHISFRLGDNELFVLSDTWEISVPGDHTTLTLPLVPPELLEGLGVDVTTIEQVKIEGYDYQPPLIDSPLFDFQLATLDSDSTVCSRQVPISTEP